MVTLSHLDEKFKKIKYLEIIKTLETNLQLKMSFQQQLHRVVFMLLYSKLGGRWDVSFLSEVLA